MGNFFTVIFSTMRWQDVVDIALNSYILFRFYVLFRETATFRVIIGLLFLWFIQKLASMIGLIITSWAIQGITAVAALIIIIVFRNEIRSVLQAKNIKAILWGFPSKKADSPVVTLSKAAFELAKRHHGALLVIPGKEDVKDVINGEVRLDGLLSRELLGTIFWPRTPMHDGAAVIEDRRVTWVKAVLPLSNRRDMPSYFGTRHRAAAGLAETTDALVIAVSEERGSVLAAKGQDLFFVQTPENLAGLIRRHYGTSRKQTEAKGRLRWQMIAAAAACFIFITGIWFSFSKGYETLVTVEVPIEYTNRDPRMAMIETSSNSIRLQLIGSGSLIRSINPDQIAVQIDLKGAVAGKNRFFITPANIKLPPGVSAKQITPGFVDVTMDIPVKKTVPVQVDWTGKLDPRLRIESVSIEPERVEIMGSGIALKNVSTVYTQKILLDGIRESGEKTVGLSLPEGSIQIGKNRNSTVKVTYVVKERFP